MTPEGPRSCVPPSCPSRRCSSLPAPLPDAGAERSEQSRGMANSRRGRARSSLQLRTIRGPANRREGRRCYRAWPEGPDSRGVGAGQGRDSSRGAGRGPRAGRKASLGERGAPARQAPLGRQPPAWRRPRRARATPNRPLEGLRHARVGRGGTD